jgi:hypothetical protein
LVISAYGAGGLFLFDHSKTVVPASMASGHVLVDCPLPFNLQRSNIMNRSNKLVFVFGSNLAGAHGAGAAAYARVHEGATLGIGEGLSGNSYALPTKDHQINSLSLEKIKEHVNKFLDFARNHPMLEFKVTQIGCGLAGFKPEQIAPMFVGAPESCYFDIEWAPWLGGSANYWGHA